MKYLFLVNPCAGSGKGQQVWRTIQQLLPQTGIDYEKVESTHPGHPRELAQRLATRREDIDCLIVIGGDGTLMK